MNKESMPTKLASRRGTHLGLSIYGLYALIEIHVFGNLWLAGDRKGSATPWAWQVFRVIYGE